MLVLSLFPGIGLLDMAFELEGFCVVRGPDVLWGGDIRNFHPPAEKFDGVIGGPPCQAFSRLAHMVRQNGYEPKFGNLIPEFERCVEEAQPQWFCMEEVPDAPVPVVGGYGVHSFILNNRQCIANNGEPATQNRTRRWSFGWRGGRKVLMVNTVAFENQQFDLAATSSSRQVPIAVGGNGKDKTSRWRDGVRHVRQGPQMRVGQLCKLQGLPDDFDVPGFTVAAKRKAVGNGVPLPMGRAIARAILEASNAESVCYEIGKAACDGE